MSSCCSCDVRDQLVGAPCTGMLGEHALARPRTDARERTAWRLQRGDDILGCRRDEDLVADREEALEPVPSIGQHGYAARGSLEQPPRRTVAELCHWRAREIDRDR